MATLNVDNQDSGVVVLRPEGALDQHGVFEISDDFTGTAINAGRAVVDLSEVQFLSTPGIAMILSTQRAMSRAGGRLVVTGVRGIVGDLLHRCRLDEVLTLAPTMDEAIEWAKVQTKPA